jgi:hypothetical protein
MHPSPTDRRAVDLAFSSLVYPVALVCMVGLLAGCSSNSNAKDSQATRDLALDGASADQQADRASSDIKRDLLQLSNASDTCSGTMLKPDPGEEGHLCAGRLTPPGYPFEVRTIRYRLGHGPSSGVQCNAGLEHQVQLYVESEVKPPATPAAPVVLTIPAQDPSTLSDEGRTVSADLSQPLVVKTGEHLFVAVKFAGQHPNVLCVGVNTEDPYQGDRNYWSNASAPPYSWKQLDTFGLKGTVMVTALGTLNK